MEGKIYCITNKLNGKVYIGQTVRTVEARYKHHLREARNGQRWDSAIHRAIAKHGPENFYVEQLATCSDQETLNALECRFITERGSMVPDGYNLCPGGYSNHNTGREHSEETKRKIGEASKGNQYNLGKKASEETRRKMSRAHKGRKFTAAHRANLSASVKAARARV